MMGRPEDDDTGELFTAKAGLVLALRSIGITDHRLLNAFEATPHEVFVPDDYSAYAYKDASLPIGCGQSITSPLVLARMLALLDPFGTSKVLEVGTGTGYSAALLSRMTRRVFSVERHEELAREASARWSAIDASGIIGFHQDGLVGLAQQAPFERILLTGSVEEVPVVLLDQLADGGTLVAPVGPPDERQVLLRLVREEDELVESEHGAVRLAPLVHGRSRAL